MSARCDRRDPFSTLLAVLFVLALASASCGLATGEPRTEVVLRDIQPTVVPEVEPSSNATPQRACSDAAPIGCPSVATGNIWTYETLVEFYGSPAAVALAGGLRDRLIAQLGCASIEPPARYVATSEADVQAALASIPDAFVAGFFAELFARQAIADQRCADPDGWLEAERGLLAFATNFETLRGESSGDLATGFADGPAVASAVVSLYERLYRFLLSSPADEASDLWLSSAHFAHVRRASLDVGGAELDAIVTGGAALSAAIDFRLLNVGEMEVFNATGVGDSLVADVALVDQLLDEATGSTVVLWGIHAESLLTPCASTEKPQAVVRQLAGQRGLLLLAGLSTFAEIGVDGSDSILAGFDPATGDSRSAPNGTNFARAASQISDVRGRFENADVCSSAVEFVAGNVKRWSAAGHRVVLFAVPISPTLGSAAGEGEVLAKSVADLETAAGPLVNFSDFSRWLTDPGYFYDLYAVNDVGRPLTTEAVGLLLTSAMQDER